MLRGRGRRCAVSPREALNDIGKNCNDMIDAYIELKEIEVDRANMTPHPVEFDMYYSV